MRTLSLFQKPAIIPTALTGHSARVSPQAILRANSNPVLTPRTSQVPSLSYHTPSIRVEAPSSYFQVREARTLFVWCIDGTVAKSVKITQASLPRLGEINRDSPMYFSTKGRLGDPLYEIELHILGSRTMSWHGLVGNTKECVSPWGSLGEIPRVALQWSGRNSMAPVSGCPWWCPICITSSGVSSSGVSRGIHHKCKHPLNLTRLYVSG
ncbi:hypothetical protein DEO72_LG11g2622 [Vigna unguiculata]|uniref:Uncharacterized protein n=1 Tax=Vigna unguiculata TaxID=3917 RepID=A0A4D6NP07_VIGUN|nr:hypothetical protein DEO72_LG11g2622 [Vigna unguiculata]